MVTRNEFIILRSKHFNWIEETSCCAIVPLCWMNVAEDERSTCGCVKVRERGSLSSGDTSQATKVMAKGAVWQVQRCIWKCNMQYYLTSEQVMSDFTKSGYKVITSWQFDKNVNAHIFYLMRERENWQKLAHDSCSILCIKMRQCLEFDNFF